MAKKHEDIFFELHPLIAERFLESSEGIRASSLKTTKTGKPYVFIRKGFLTEALELVQIIWEELSDEVNKRTAARYGK